MQMLYRQLSSCQERIFAKHTIATRPCSHMCESQLSSHCRTSLMCPLQLLVSSTTSVRGCARADGVPIWCNAKTRPTHTTTDALTAVRVCVCACVYGVCVGVGILPLCRARARTTAQAMYFGSHMLDSRLCDSTHRLLSQHASLPSRSVCQHVATER